MYSLIACKSYNIYVLGYHLHQLINNSFVMRNGVDKLRTYPEISATCFRELKKTLIDLGDVSALWTFH